MSQKDTATTSGPRSPWTGRGFLFAGAGVLLIVVLLVVVLVMTSGSGQDQRAVPAPPPGPVPTSATSSAAPVDEGPTTVPTSTPQGVRWDIYRTVALPVSDKAGPRQVTDSTATGYAHTPTGALLAASQIPVRKLIAPDWRAVVEQQIMPGTGRDAYIAGRAQVTDNSVAPGQLAQLAAFKVVNYSDTTATIQLVSRFASGNMQLVTITVQWANGDWKEVLQPDGGDSPNAQKVTDLIGYIGWGGV